jgi:Ca2+-binding RTX toxin-like protein
VASTLTARLYGRVGNDDLRGSEEASGDYLEELYGNAGRDYLEGNAGDDNLYGNEDGDYLVGGVGADVLRGQAGDDYLVGDMIALAAATDVLRGGDGDDQLCATHNTIGVTHTTAIGSWGIDCVSNVDATNDLLFGEADDDTMWGSAGENELWGGSGDDEMHGYDGLDKFDARGGLDHVEGGAGTDLICSADQDYIRGGGDADTLWFDNVNIALISMTNLDAPVGGACPGSDSTNHVNPGIFGAECAIVSTCPL